MYLRNFYWEGLEAAAMNAPTIEILVSKYRSLTNQDSLENRLIPGLQTEKIQDEPGAFYGIGKVK